MYMMTLRNTTHKVQFSVSVTILSETVVSNTN